MGKKKSKTGKQKQAKASRKFGVAVKQGKREQMQFVPNPKQRPQNNASPLSSSSKPSKTVVTKESTKNVSGRKTRDPEDVEFHRQMASAQERTRRRRCHHDGTNVKRQPFALAPATFVVDDKEKSTSRLLEEATVCVQQGFQGIGNGPLAKQRLPTWAVDDNQPASLQVDNPYAVLRGDCSSDEEGLTPRPLLLFRLAPPTFSIATTQDDVDPDL